MGEGLKPSPTLPLLKGGGGIMLLYHILNIICKVASYATAQNDYVLFYIE